MGGFVQRPAGPRHHDLLSAVVQLVPAALPKFTTSLGRQMVDLHGCKCLGDKQTNYSMLVHCRISRCYFWCCSSYFLGVLVEILEVVCRIQTWLYFPPRQNMSNLLHGLGLVLCSASCCFCWWTLIFSSGFYVSTLQSPKKEQRTNIMSLAKDLSSFEFFVSVSFLLSFALLHWDLTRWLKDPDESLPCAF